MKEGAWINAATGDYRWLDEHARWLQRPGNAAIMGIPAEVIEELGQIPWDFNGSGRKAILMLAMDHGLIRARGQGASITFEFTIPWEQAIRGSLTFMENLGPAMTCRFNCLSNGQSVEFLLGHVRERLEQDDLTFLLPPWQRPRTQPPIPRPFLVVDQSGKGTDWACWQLPGELDTKGLVALIRGHVPVGGGWLGLADGRIWKVTPTTPPLLLVDDLPALSRFQVCPGCGWPHAEPHAPCQCRPRTPCRLCQMPIYWPIPGYDTVHLDGTVLHVAHFVAYAHVCIPWPKVRVLDLQDLRGRS